jgi:endonuclease YncB( thermonuclease family)
MKNLLILLAVVLGHGSLFSQQGIDLSSIRETWMMRIQASTQVLDDQYASHLAKLELQVAEKGDYEEALKIQKRRLQLGAVGSGAAGTFGSTPGSIILLPKDARVGGKVDQDLKNRILGGFKSEGSFAEWRILKVEPGDYTVKILYALGESIYNEATDTYITTGGRYKFYEDTRLSIDNLNSITEKPETTGGWSIFRHVTIGSFTLERSSATFRFEALSAGTAGLINIKGIELVPSAPATAVADANGDAPMAPINLEPGDLTALRITHQKRLQELRASILSAYEAKLNALEQNATTEKDLPAVSMLRNERRIAREATAIIDMESLLNPSNQTSPDGSGTNQSQKATIAAIPPASATAFSIISEGSEIPVRLYLVESPGINPKEPERLAYQNYFNIGDQDVLEVARLGADHTTKYLANKQFLVYSQGDYDVDGRLFVSIRVPGVGDYGRVLIMKGLAARLESLYPQARYPLHPTHKILSNSYSAMEKKARESRLGAWSLSETSLENTNEPEFP